MFRRHNRIRPIKILFVIFRLFLSVVMFAVLLGGIYLAYKHFSGLDPIKLNPQTLISNLLSSKSPTIKLGQDITERINKKILGQSQKDLSQIPLENLTKSKTTSSKLAFSFMLVADSHNDNINLRKALTQAKDKNPKFIIGLGDYTDVGTIDEMRLAKKEFDSSGLRYFLTPGDHDLWDCRNRSLPPNCNFREVFGPSYQSFKFDNFLFIILYNSDNYLGLGEQQWKWLTGELQKAKEDEVFGLYVFLHEPLFHPSSDHVMGRVEPRLKTEAQTLIRALRDGMVRQVFAGDIHYFSQYTEPETNLNMVTISAITSLRNIQAPRFAVVKVFEDGSIQVEDLEVK